MADVPAGFSPLNLAMGFLEANGPLYGKWIDERLLVGFRIEMRHCNPAKVAHGGMLATFADMLLPLATRAQSKADLGFLPTVSLACDFLAPAPLGAWVEGRAESLTATRNLVFAQGMAMADNTPCLRANGIFKIAPYGTTGSAEFLKSVFGVKTGT
ncbi:MAG TPA: PaaI family thioesterase [Rhizomicrobium sp.]|jgi:acyl-coenzyme A thioesterase PaaI-like protein